ncbi:hypothetical protein GCM10011491_41290 [Brucella endophytica]|uniref:Uncharacterized protein n=1 Tax=Brucella endophytica TaxID=1963359 RepID=A0A916WKL8_9HYPH|nr:hypothetical protein [Brucella endophytica]GGB09078.1 hypothetical protein GCM10011491_41290 [Brucella endophytica]
MSRHIVTVTQGERKDDNGVIGYDPPLRTFFLNAFVDKETDEPELWLGWRRDEFPTLESIILAARSNGYELSALSQDTILSMLAESSKPARLSLGERLGIVL